MHVIPIAEKGGGGIAVGKAFVILV